MVNGKQQILTGIALILLLGSTMKGGSINFEIK
jgi:hypothetical protein